VTPAVTVNPGTTGSITTAQALNVVVSVTASTGTATGSVVLSSGSYASFPVAVSNGSASIVIPAGLLATGMDTLTANFSPANAATYNSASGTAGVTVTASGVALPVVTASSVTYPTIGSPFRALPVASGDVLVSLTAATSGIQVFKPAGAALQASCFNYLRAAFVQDGAPVFGIDVLPNGLGAGAALGLEGAIFYSLSTLQNCTSTGFVVSQGAVSADEGTFDVAVTPDGKYAFLANEYGVASGSNNQGNIGVIALQYDASGIVTTGTTQLGQISTAGQILAGITLSPDGTRLYVTSETAASPNTGAGSANPVLGKSNCVQQQMGGAVTANGLLTVIDVAKAVANPNSSAIIATVDAGCGPVRVAETADQSTLWVAARGDNRVLAFSSGMLESNPGNALLGYVDSGGTAPVGLRLFNKQKLLAVANSNRFGVTGGMANATILSVAVPAAASVVQTVATGLFPREITVGSDDLTLYLTNYNSQSFQVITTTVQ
jgi:hypothetical protein